MKLILILLFFLFNFYWFIMVFKSMTLRRFLYIFFFYLIFILILIVITNIFQNKIQFFMLGLILLAFLIIYFFKGRILQLNLKLYFKRILYMFFSIINIFFIDYIDIYIYASAGFIFLFILIYPYEFKFLTQFEIYYNKYKNNLLSSNLFYYFYNKSNKYVILIYYTLLISIFIFIKFSLFIYLFVHFLILWNSVFIPEYNFYNKRKIFKQIRRKHKLNFRNFIKKINKCKSEIKPITTYISYFYIKDITNELNSNCLSLSTELKYRSIILYFLDNRIESFFLDYKPSEILILYERELKYISNNIKFLLPHLTERVKNGLEIGSYKYILLAIDINNAINDYFKLLKFLIKDEEKIKIKLRKTKFHK